MVRTGRKSNSRNQFCAGTPLFVDRIHDAFANAKYVAVRVTQVHFTNLPWHVGRRKSDVPAIGQAWPVDFVDIIHPNRRPDKFEAEWRGEMRDFTTESQRHRGRERRRRRI
jgi:hypothetical protein